MALDSILLQMVKNFKNGDFTPNQYWYFYFGILSDIMSNLAVCEVNLENDDNCINLSSLSAKISTNEDNDLFEKAGELILYALTHNGKPLLRHPREVLKEQIPESLIQKAELLYNELIVDQMG